MQKSGLMLMLFVLGIFLCSGSAFAGPYPSRVANDYWSGVANGIPTARDNNDGGPDINDAITALLGTNYDTNKDVDPLFVEPDYVWQQMNGTIAVIGLSAGYTNALGVYTDLGVGNAKSVISAGNTGFVLKPPPYQAFTVSLPHHSLFGWYLETSVGTTYYSEPGLNHDSFDHMMTFSLASLDGASIDVMLDGRQTALTLESAYLIAWEDLSWIYDSQTIDEDYDDIMYLVTKVQPVPEPATMLLFGAGLLGLTGVGRKRILKRL